MSATRTILDLAGRALAAESARMAGFGWMRGTSGNLYMRVRDLTQARHHAETIEWLLRFQIEARER